MAKTRVVVVGAGAAGLTAGLRAAEGGATVTLLNAHPKIGLKILMSGGTRCNVTHREVSERDFNAGSRAFVRHVLATFPVGRTIEWLETLGVALKLEESGKCFPESDDAHTVLEALVSAVEHAGVSVETGARVVRLEALREGASRGGGAPRAAEEAQPRRESRRGPTASGRAQGEDETRAARHAETGSPAAPPRFRLGIQTVHDSAAFGAGVAPTHGVTEWRAPAVEPDRWLEADAVVLATGGLSFPRTGSDGTGYALAAALGHTIEPPTPALTPLTAEDPLCGLVQGVTVEAELRLGAGGKPVAATRGSLLFTHFGYSGPAALDLSRHWLRAAGSEREVRASFLPDTRGEHLDHDLVRIGAAEPRLTLRRALARNLPERLAEALCREAGADPAGAVSQLPRALRARVVERLVLRPLPVNGTLGYEKAEVTAGGVRLSEVSTSTLESRLVPGLYLCGEILDVEGRLGGFNFQWAWSSGSVAGRAAGGDALRLAV